MLNSHFLWTTTSDGVLKPTIQTPTAFTTRDAQLAIKYSSTRRTTSSAKGQRLEASQEPVCWRHHTTRSTEWLLNSPPSHQKSRRDECPSRWGHDLHERREEWLTLSLQLLDSLLKAKHVAWTVQELVDRIRPDLWRNVDNCNLAVSHTIGHEVRLPIHHPRCQNQAKTSNSSVHPPLRARQPNQSADPAFLP